MLLSEVYKNNSTKRIDSEYFLKQDLVLADYMEKNNFQTFNELNIVVKGGKRIPKGENFSEEGYPYIRAQDNKNNLIFSEMSPKISESIYKKLKNYDVKYNEIIITNVGNSIGDVGIFKEDDKKCILTENCVKVYNKNTLLREYIYTFLKTKYGMSQIRRETVGTAQPKLALERIREFKIAKISRKIQEKIKGLVDNSVDNIILSKKLYYQAEKFFISELGFENFNPSSERVSIKTLKESFLRTGRFDSEYYQPKYDDYLKKVFSYTNGYELLEECCTIKDKNFMPKEDEKYRYIELANVRSNAQICDCDVLLGKELPTRARRKVNIGDVIVSSIEGSLESCALITEEYNNALCSTGFYVVNSEKLNSESLLTVFKSSLISNLMKKGCSGTILTNISKEEFVKLPIPILKTNVQNEIASYIRQSMEYSQKAKELLNTSTKIVEIAIDKSEKEAHNFLEKRREEKRREEKRREEKRR